MKPKVLITGSIPEEWLGELDDIAEVFIWKRDRSYLMPRNRLLEAITSCAAVINFAEIKADEAFIAKAGNLKIIANASIGFDNLNLDLLTAKKIWATNAPGYFNYPVAEFAFAGILALARKIGEADDFVRQGQWNAFEPGRWDGTSLRDQVVGLIGYGTIGRALKKMIQCMGSEVIHYSPSSKTAEGWTPFEDLIRTADIISVHVPLTPQTYHLIDGNVIASMKQGAIFVNTSRGGVADQDALVKAIVEGKLAGAVLDVFETEPQVPEVLKQMKNVILTPHMAGGTKAAREACLKRAIQNVTEVLKGNAPLNPLNNPLK